MDALEYLKVKVRMCRKYSCGRCPLRQYDNIDATGYQANYSCTVFERKEPEKAVAIVEKWAKENPPKTYKDVLLEKLPNVKINKGGFPRICVSELFNTEKYCNDVSINCRDCWNREYKEVEKGLEDLDQMK